MRFRNRRISRFRRTIAGLAVAALTWSSGQGAALSAAFQLAGLDAANAWHCVMMAGGGGMPAGQNMAQNLAADAPTDKGAPPDGDSGFCPVCSLTGCTTPSVVAQAEFHYVAPGQRYRDTVRSPAAVLVLAAVYQRPRARAPPLSL